MNPATGSEPARTITLDAHVHTDASYDCAASPEGVVAGALDAGVDAIAVTDHDTVDGVRRAVAAAEGRDLLVVPGVEVSTADGHLLALGVDAVPTPDRSLAETVASVRDDDGVAVVPHPFQRSRHGVRPAALTDCDAVETLNAVGVTGVANGRARRFAAAAGYPAVGGSDAHTPDLVGRAVTSVELPAGVDWTTVTTTAVLDAVRAGDVTARGGLTTPVEFARTYGWHARTTAATARDSAGTAATAGRTAVVSRPTLGVGAALGVAAVLGTGAGLSARAGAVGSVPRRIAERVR